MSESPPANKPKRERKIPTIECKKTECSNNLHCYLDPPKTKKLREHLSSVVPDPTEGLPSSKKSSRSHYCWNCGINLVDWDRVHARNLNDVEYIFGCLRCEYVRHQYWHKELDPWATNQAKRRGRLRIPEYAEKRILQSVGAAHPFNDSRQTPAGGDVLFYAQHATATCCRRCMEIWYGIPQGRELTEEEVAFCTKILILYVDLRLPDLPDAPQKVPGIRKQSFKDAPSE